MDNNNIKYTFVNVKKDPIDKSFLGKIAGILGMDSIFNMKGPTFRKFKLNYTDLSSKNKLNLLFENQGMIKRPLLEKDIRFSVGYDEEKILDFAKE